MDWDAHGQPFFINTVIGHLWHVVPGAHYERMFGEDFNPRLYSLMPQTADHVHWDAGEEWRDIRDLGVTPGTDRAGGGHAHSGLMVYGGDNWPAAYRGNAFTLNFHGRRINRELLERRGAAYVGRHAPDVARFQDPWFRGLDLIYGQDGAVYVADWTDAGECHDSDGVHRNSGRIFKIMYGDAALRPAVDLAARSDLELIALLAHENDHFARQARTILQGRAAAGLPMDESRAALLRRFDEGTSVPCRLRALWCLQATGGLPSDWLQGLLADESEHLRAWAVRLLEENDALRGPALAELVRLAAREPSGLVQLTLASALQRLPLADRWPLALALARRDEFAEDPALPRMIWYGVEPAVPADPRRAVELASQSAMPLLQRHVARRLAEDLRSHPEPVADLGRRAAASESTALRREVLRGVAAALQGWRRVAPPAGWPDWLRQESASDDPERAALARELAVVFGDGRAAAELRAVAADARQPLEVRRAALESLVASRDAELPPLLRQLLADRDLVTDAARGLAAFDDPETARLLVEHYHLARSHARTAAVDTLVSRPKYLPVLLAALADGTIAPRDVSSFQVRQLWMSADEPLRARLQALWPELRHSPAEKAERIAHFQRLLTPARLASADRARGRGLFDKACASCHRLFGHGGRIGPELTGAQRDNLFYLLHNLVDPSAQVAENYRLSTVTTADGRVLSGVAGETTPETMALQTATERLVIPRSEIAAVEPTELSLMPERMLDALAEDEAADLFAYLMSPQQVEAGPEAP
jgi:putative heme-binding domain-containing protein